MRCITTATFVLAASVLVLGQTADPPAVEEVFRQLPPNPHALEFLQMGLHGPMHPQVFGTNIDGNFIPAYKVGGGVTAPRGIKMPDPDYPEKLRARGIEGAVLLWVVVGTDGSPHDITIGRSGGFEFDKAAIKAVNKWRFKPATKDGTPVAARINVEVNFRLYH
ncbi:MAG: energy transducer TonB [Acidobacteriia bacterium]|nr:energy transducer TonB [Terriglobia bacterium]